MTTNLSTTNTLPVEIEKGRFWVCYSVLKWNCGLHILVQYFILLYRVIEKDGRDLKPL